MEALEPLRSTRRETLRLVEGLSQAQVDFSPGPAKWSVGEILDHLIRVDLLFRDEYEELVRQGRNSGCAFRFRGLSETGLTLPLVPDALLPLFDLPAAVMGVVIPRPVRQIVLGNRSVPAQAPPPIQPRKGRAADDLRRDLRAAVERLEALLGENRNLRLDRLYYYNPLIGLTDLPGMTAFTASHESRHQEQLREILAQPGFPAGPA